MHNPLAEKYSEEKNQELVRKSLSGDRKALDELVRMHQPFIYNVAWKMAWEPNDALDLTQEALIKVITKLSQFNFESQFRTWLYRIVVNEFLQAKRRKGEKQFSTKTTTITDIYVPEGVSVGDREFQLVTFPQLKKFFKKSFPLSG